MFRHMKAIRSLRTHLFLSIALLSCSNVQGDDIFVSGLKNGQGAIERIDSNGNKTVFASGLYTYGIAFGRDGNLYAAVEGDLAPGSGTIQKFDINGNASVVASGLDRPSGIAFDHSEALYVVNGGNGTVKKLGVNGSFGNFISGLNYEPRSLAFDSSGNLFVSSLGPSHPAFGIIQKFDSNGVLALWLSDAVSHPYGLAFDNNGNLFAAQTSNGTILKYDPSGNRTVYATGLNTPASLAFDSVGNLFVGDLGSRTIEKFDLNGNRSTFATGLDWPLFIAIQTVPEPSYFVFVALALGGLLWSRARVSFPQGSEGGCGQ